MAVFYPFFFSLCIVVGFKWRAASAYDNGLGRKPPMGWSSWCTGGTNPIEPSFCNLLGHDPCSEEQVKQTADAIVESGMKDLGYEYVTLDDCWSSKSRDAQGNLQPESSKFPSGMASLADYVHARGLKFGLYTSLGDQTCKGSRPGSFQHYEQDAKTVTSWGVDFVKMDHCGGRNGTDQELYGSMSKALNATGRPVLFSLCNWGESEVWKWGGEIAQMFRIQMDHLPFWKFGSANSSDGVGYGQGTYDIIEWMGDLVPSKWTRRFGWMDPDFLMTRYLTMDFTASRTEFTFWAIWSAPLLVSTDLRELAKDADKRAILMNEEVIAINQDDLATGGDRIIKRSDGGQVWARDLANSDKCVVLYNSGLGKRIGGHDIELGVSWEQLGWSTEDLVGVRNLWARQNLGNMTMGLFNVTIKPRDVVMLRLRRL